MNTNEDANANEKLVCQLTMCTHYKEMHVVFEHTLKLTVIHKDCEHNEGKL